jgi:quinoprotein glucose dehydrogenase
MSHSLTACNRVTPRLASKLRTGGGSFWRVFLAAWLLPVAAVWAVDPAPPPAEPTLAKASNEGQQALQGFKLPAGWQRQLFAAEPQLANPVAFCIDPVGRLFVCETFRQSKGVEDNRGREYWLNDDLAAQTVDDRVAYVKKHLKEKADEFVRHDDRIRLLVDRDGDGQADEATVFAKHFNRISDGTGAGVLFHRGAVYYTCIPDLWKLTDTNQDGVADERASLHFGYGVRYAFRGHDLHGLCVGPDGKIYFSLGDRGYNVVSQGRRWKNPECGAVFRCDADGNNLEVFAYGLRNPQELAFDDYGNLFTGDNNSDSGDQARWVYVMEGGDTGWRMSYQYLPDRGPFNREKIWHPAHAEQPAYVAPPIRNLGSGPSGLAYYPGTGLGAHFQNRFFLCDFRGGPGGSGIRTFRVKPKGAFFEVVDEEFSITNVLATDVDFGPDGAVYVSDWVDGWNGLNKGRIHRFFDPEQAQSPLVKQVKELLASDLTSRVPSDVVPLLGHADRRVRQAAQFALVDRQAQTELIAAAKQPAARATLARIHAIWGLGQLLASSKGSSNAQGNGAASAPSAVAAPSLVSEAIVSLLADEDAEVRAQAAKVAGDRRLTAAAPALIERLTDSSERVRYFAAISLGKTAGAEAVRPLVELLAANNDQDPALRHAAIFGLAQVGGYRGWEPESAAASADSATNTVAPTGSLKVDGARSVEREAITGQLRHPSAAARLGLAVVLRRLGMPDLAKLLDDADPRVVVEAARGIHDEPIAGALPALAGLAGRDLSNDALARRVLNANYRLGATPHAQAIAQVAARASTPEPMKLEAIEMLANWDKPSPKDRVLNMWRPLAERSRQPAVDAFRAVLPTLVARADKAGAEAAKRAAGLGIQEVGPMLRGLLADLNQSAGSRAEALRALATLKDAQLLAVARSAADDKQPAVRAVARDLLAKLQPQEVLPLLRAAAQSEAMIERQAAWTTLGGVSGADVDELFVQGLDQLLAGQTPADSRLELLTAAGLRKNDAVQSRLKQYVSRRPADDPLAAYAETLAGGDPERGARIFFERAQVSCVRCHKVQGRGGDVGPELTKIGGEKNAAYLLESIVLPNKTIAKNFESVLVVDDSGKVISGVIKAEDAQTLQLVTAEGGLVKIDKSVIEERRAAKSPMPEDLIKQLTSYELRDLIAYLSSLR